VDAVHGRPWSPMDMFMAVHGRPCTAMFARNFFRRYCAVGGKSQYLHPANKCTCVVRTRFSTRQVQKVFFFCTEKYLIKYFWHPLQVRIATAHSFCLAILSQITLIICYNTRGLTERSLFDHGVQNRANRASALSLID
jgi:hypothetical protein